MKTLKTSKKNLFATLIGLLLVACQGNASNGPSADNPLPTQPPAISVETLVDLRNIVRDIATSDRPQAQAIADALWQTLVNSQRVPLVFDNQIIFLYKGTADSVTWRGDFTHWGNGEGLEGKRIGETDLWIAQVSVPIASRTEYKIVLNEKDWILDPVNLRLQRGGFGDNNVVTADGFSVTLETQRRDGIPMGTLTDARLFQSQNLGYAVSYRVYLPAGYDQLSQLPVVYVTDGNEFADELMGAMPIILDNLIGTGRIKPIMAVFLDAREPGNLENNRRKLEFVTHAEAYARFVTEEIVPMVDATYRTDPSADARVIQGTSLGGLNASFIATLYPNVFHNLAVFSPAYGVLFNPGASDDPQQSASINKMAETIQRAQTCGAESGIQCPPLLLNIFITSGIPDWDIGDLFPTVNDLRTKQYPVNFIQVQEGHSWGAWKGLLDEMLVYFFGSDTQTLQTLPTIASNLTTNDFSAIDHYVEQEMDAGRIPGLALGIVKGDQIVHLKGFGKADETGRPVTPQTPFVLGSTTKSFTALAVMQLVEAGKIELDAPVQRYLPWFSVADAEASAQITIRHLLNHTSGLPAKVGTTYILKQGTSRSALEDEVRALQNVALDRSVGELFEYCNLNYGILGLVIESVSGESYEQYVEENIFTPLGMSNSFADYQEAQKHNLAQGYLYWWEMPQPKNLIYNRAGLPSGYLVSSAEDMSHYLIAQLNDGHYGDVTILSEAGLAQTHQPAVQATMMGDSASYGMGWFIGEMDGAQAVWHPGGVMNFHSDLILAPKSGWGVVLLFNASHLPDAPGAKIASGVLSLLEGNQPPVSARPFPIAQSALLVILVIQIAGIVRSVKIFKRWRSQPESMPRGSAKTALNIWLPFALNLLWTVLLLFVVPSSQGSRIQDLTMLDIGQEVILSGFLALGWALIRMFLAYREIRGRAV